jgi:hypothetical protein
LSIQDNYDIVVWEEGVGDSVHKHRYDLYDSIEVIRSQISKLLKFLDTIYLSINTGENTSTHRDAHAGRRSPEFDVELDIIYIAYCSNAQFHSIHSIQWDQHSTMVRAWCDNSPGTHWDL